jgi:putative copper export protein/mono/diheme cytochrome c family protein
MTGQFLVTAAIRWAGLVALATLGGSLVLAVLVLPREPPEVGPVRARLRRLGVICLVVLVATTVGELVTRAQTMAGGDLAAAVSAIPAVAARTHFGMVWIGRLIVLLLALLVVPVASRAALIAGLVLTLGVTVTTSLTGHAADWGDLTLSAGLDWVHVLATSAWTGGIISLGLAVLGPARGWPPALLGTVMRRFSRLAGLCLLAVVVTGSYNAWVQLPRVSALWTTVYGRVLAVKLLLVLGLIGWGAVTRYTIVPRLGSRQRFPGVGERVFRLARWATLGSSRVARRALPSRLRAYMRREAGLVILVLAATAVLVDSTPARHAEHGEHHALMEPGPFRVTMEALHESGGVPAGWIFVPPEGDAARGREVFLRLGCYACHRIARENLPPPSGLGPDLTGVGGHHPAGYILESILNPNTVIVDGRGYTGPDGKSIMPDYRGQLSVADLIDLVAYLKTR